MLQVNYSTMLSVLSCRVLWFNKEKKWNYQRMVSYFSPGVDQLWTKLSFLKETMSNKCERESPECCFLLSLIFTIFLRFQCASSIRAESMSTPRIFWQPKFFAEIKKITFRFNCHRNIESVQWAELNMKLKITNCNGYQSAIATNVKTSFPFKPFLFHNLNPRIFFQPLINLRNGLIRNGLHLHW